MEDFGGGACLGDLAWAEGQLRYMAKEVEGLEGLQQQQD